MKTMFHRVKRPLGRTTALAALVILSAQVQAQVKDPPRQVDSESKPAEVKPRKPAAHVAAKDAGKVAHAAKSSGEAAEKVTKHGSVLKKLPSRSPLGLVGLATDLVGLTGITSSKKKEPVEATPARPAKSPAPEPRPRPRREKDSPIFDDVQLTGKEAKDLEAADPFGDIELTGVKGKTGG